MYMDMTTVVTIVGVAGTVATIIGAFLGYRKGVKQDGAGEGSLRSDVGYIKAGVDDVKSELKEQRDRHYELAKKVVEVEASAKSAHHRIDGLEGDIERLEAKL